MERDLSERMEKIMAGGLRGIQETWLGMRECQEELTLRRRHRYPLALRMEDGC